MADRQMPSSFDDDKYVRYPAKTRSQRNEKIDSLPVDNHNRPPGNTMRPAGRKSRASCEKNP